MKFIKKLKVAILAGVFMMTAVTSVFSFATTESDNEVKSDSCDVNRNGVVNATDSLILLQYLNGMMYDSNTTIMDVDRNNIVSWADYQCISANLMSGPTYSNTVEGGTKFFYNEVITAGRGTSFTGETKYKRYNYNSKSELSDYSLSIGTANATADIELYGAIGDDTRKPDKMDGIVFVYDSEGKCGTGFIVGDHIIATAAHCVYTLRTVDENGKVIPAHWNSDVKVTIPNSEGVVDYNISFDAIEAHVPDNYLNQKDTVENDYALITVKEDLSGYYHFELGIPYNMYDSNNDFKNYEIYVTGFPGELLGANGNIIENRYPRKMYTGTGKLVNVGASYLTYNTDASPGNSGGPAYVKETYYINGARTMINTVIGICTTEFFYRLDDGTKVYTYNGGTAMTPIMLKFFKNNPNVSY